MDECDYRLADDTDNFVVEKELNTPEIHYMHFEFYTAKKPMNKFWYLCATLKEIFG